MSRVSTLPECITKWSRSNRFAALDHKSVIYAALQKFGNDLHISYNFLYKHCFVIILHRWQHKPRMQIVLN